MEKSTPPLTHEQALVNLDIFTSRIQGSREEHATIQESIRVLARALNIPVNPPSVAKE